MHILKTYLVGAVLLVACSASQASVEAIADLRQSMINLDMEEFSRVLESGVIGLDEFGLSDHLYELACVSPYEAYSEFFDRLLDYGMDPSTEDPSGHPQVFSLLVCAAREFNLDAFKKLLDAGARSEIVTCPTCDSETQSTLVDYVLLQPDFFVEIAKRRELTNNEMIRVAKYLGRRHLTGTYQNQPLNEFYADYLRERGIDVTPKGPYKPE
jgi:hypothetical protein